MREEKKRDGKYEADFFNIVAWEKTAELIARYCAKGSKILIEGRLQTSSYEKNGEKKFSTEILAERIELAGSSGGQKSNPIAIFKNNNSNQNGETSLDNLKLRF